MSEVPQQVESSGPVQTLEYGTAPGAGALLARTFDNPRFIVAFALLLAAAIGLNLTVKVLRLNFRKQPVPMRMRFDEALPSALAVGGQWLQIARTQVLEEDTLHSLGTDPDKFLFCNYVRVNDPEKQKAILAKLSTLNVKEQQDELTGLRKAEQPSIGLGLTYYTGTVDTVAHIPERCYLGGGYDQVANRRQVFILKDRHTGQKRTMNATLVTFRNPLTGRVRYVSYFFSVNGQYEDDATVVRAILADLRARRAYYAKVEMSFDPLTEAEQKDESAATGIMRDFLESALPELEKVWPQFEK